MRWIWCDDVMYNDLIIMSLEELIKIYDEVFVG